MRESFITTYHQLNIIQLNMSPLYNDRTNLSYQIYSSQMKINMLTLLIAISYFEEEITKPFMKSPVL